MNRQLNVIPVLFNRKDNQCFRILLKVTAQLHYLFLGISMYFLRKFYFLFTVLKFHMRQLLSFHRFSGVDIVYHIFTIPASVFGYIAVLFTVSLRVYLVLPV